jgi:uncharacterized membrane protein YqjE
MSVPPPAATPSPLGLPGALRALGGTLLEILETRGGLLAVELGEELERRKRMLVLGAVAFAFLHTALLLATLLVAVVFWDDHRVAAMVVMIALYLACGVAALRRLIVEDQASPTPFAASLGELQHDVASLRSAT